MYLVHLVDDCGIPVMRYGLRADFRGELFLGSYELLVMADKLEEVKRSAGAARRRRSMPASGRERQGPLRGRAGRPRRNDQKSSVCAAAIGWPATRPRLQRTGTGD